MRCFPAVMAVGLMIGACAKSADRVAPTYISPVTYEHLSCAQIAQEAQRVSQRAAVAAGVQDDKATKDALATTIGIVIFWPALFFIGGNDQTTAELGRLRGEMEALEQASVRKNCGIQFRRQ